MHLDAKLQIVDYSVHVHASDLCLWDLGPLITPKQWSSKTAREISPDAWEISPTARGIRETVGYCSRASGSSAVTQLM